MTSALLQYSLGSIHTEMYLMSTHSSMEELVLTKERQVVPRGCIDYVEFILPLAELESGLFHMSGAYLLYTVHPLQGINIYL